MRKVVAYIRVAKGLRVTDQHADVEQFCRENGYELASKDLELAAAIEHARSLPALLVIPRLYPLSRDPAVIGALLEGGVEFRAIDLPDANRAWLRAHKPVAKQEADAHSELIKASIKIARIDPKVKIGNPATRERGSPAAALEKSVAKRRTLRDRTIAAVAGRIVGLRAHGLDFGAIAHALNDDRLRTVTGKSWGARSVERVARRIGGATAVPIRRRSRREIRRGDRFITYSR